jgi:UDP-glucose 4-epimerase
VRAVVLGAAGFIGSHLCRRLVAEGWSVTAVMRDANAIRPRLVLDEALNAIEVKVGDATDPALLTMVLPGADAVFPLYGRADRPYAEQHPSADLHLHAASQLVLLDVVRRTAPEARVIYPGSRLQYGPADALPVPESHPQRPVSVYGIHKVLGEQYHLHYHRRHGLRSTVLRISVVYGAHQIVEGVGNGIVGKLMALAGQGMPIELHGGGNQRRDFVHIDDLTDLFVKAVASPNAPGRVFNAGGGVATSFRTLAAAIITTIGRGSIVSVPVPDGVPEAETADFVGDISAAKELLAWQPQVSLDKGIAVTWAAEVPAH